MQLGRPLVASSSPGRAGGSSDLCSDPGHGRSRKPGPVLRREWNNTPEISSLKTMRRTIQKDRKGQVTRTTGIGTAGRPADNCRLFQGDHSLAYCDGVG